MSLLSFSINQRGATDSQRRVGEVEAATPGEIHLALDL
jgi:hypothetical protein